MVRSPLMKHMHRLLSIDLMRGHFLIAMIVDHLAVLFAPSLFIFYNGNGRLWVSAAEGFLFLAGIMLGYFYVYNLKHSLADVSKKMLKRAIILYGISVTLTIVFSLTFWGRPFPLTGVLFGSQSPSVTDIVVRAITFEHHYGWINILNVYMFLFLISPILIWLFRKKKSVIVIILSICLWALANSGLIHFTAHGIFEIFSWQLLFVAGMCIGANYPWWREQIITIRQHTSLAIVLVILWLVAVIVGVIFESPTIGGYALFAKEVLSLGRVLLFPLWFIATWIVLSFITSVLPNSIRAFYEFLGRNSLTVYTLHAILLPIAMAMGLHSVGYVWNSVGILICLIILGAVTYGIAAKISTR